MKCIEIENEVKTINTMRHQTIDKWKGTAAVAAAGPPGQRALGPKPPPPPPPPFICIWFDVSLYWSFSLPFPFVYISFCASNVYSTYILVIISIIWLLCFIFTSWYSKKGAYLTFLAVGRSRPTHKIEFPTRYKNGLYFAFVVVVFFTLPLFILFSAWAFRTLLPLYP